MAQAQSAENPLRLWTRPENRGTVAVTIPIPGPYRRSGPVWLSTEPIVPWRRNQLRESPGSEFFRCPLRVISRRPEFPVRSAGHDGCAAFIMESRMKYINATKLHRKSGGRKLLVKQI